MNELARQVQARVLGPAGMTRTVASQWDRSKMDVVYDMARGIRDCGRRVRPAPPTGAGAGGRRGRRLDRARPRPVRPGARRRLAGVPGGHGEADHGRRLTVTATCSRTPTGGTSRTTGASGSCGTPGGTTRPARRRCCCVCRRVGSPSSCSRMGRGVHWDNPLDGAAVEQSPVRPGVPRPLRVRPRAVVAPPCGLTRRCKPTKGVSVLGSAGHRRYFCFVLPPCPQPFAVERRSVRRFRSVPSLAMQEE